MRAILSNRIKLPYGEMTAAERERVCDAFTHPDPEHQEAIRAGRRPTCPPNIRTWRVDGQWLTLPRGGLERLKLLVRIDEVVDDTRCDDPLTVDEIPDHAPPWRMRPDQLDAIDAIARERTCLVRAFTGVGKTSLVIGAIGKLKLRSIILVWSANLLKQWQERLELEMGLRGDDVGIVREDVRRIRPITIGMQQTVLNRLRAGDDELQREFDFVACDEVQRFAADTLFATVDPFEARYRVGVSADESRRDQKEFLIYDLFGKVAYEIDEAKALEIGAVVDVEVRVVPSRFRPPPAWYRARDYDRNRVLLEAMVRDPERNALIVGIAKKAHAAGEQSLIFTDRVEHARWIDAELTGMGVPSGTMLGGKSEERVFEETKARMVSRDASAAVGTYLAIGQALDIPSVSVGIAATPVGNNRQKLGQVKGRLCRNSDGKKSGRIYYVLDPCFGRKPIRNFVEWYRSVKVWDRGKWVDGKEFLKAPRAPGGG